MCDACVIETVKSRMLSRRSFFRAAAAGAATVASASSGALSPALAQAPTKVTDLTHELHEEFPTFFGQQQFWREQKFNYKEHKFNLFELRVNEHTGTHLDAPLHFSEDGKSVAEIPVSDLVVPLAVIDIREKAAANADAQLTPDDIKAWIAANGELPRGRMDPRVSGLTRSGLVLSSAPVELGLAAVLEGRNAAARAVVANGGKIIGRAQARLSPLPDAGDIVSRLTAAPLFAQLRYDGPADILWRLTGVETKT